MFREVILMSFSCPHCNASNCEIQPGAPLQDKGVRYTFEVCHPQVRCCVIKVYTHTLLGMWAANYTE